VKISSPVGEYDYHVEHVTLRDGRLEVIGRLGEWETTTFLDRSDLRNLLRKVAPALMVGSGIWVVTKWLRRV
jgi:hypothetical protein